MNSNHFLCPARGRHAAARAVAIIFFISLITSCGGGGAGVSRTGTATPSTQIRFGDSAADSVIAFEVTVASPILLQPSGGGAKVPVTVGGNRLELSHTAAKFEPLGVVTVPTGSYSSADITILNPELTFLNSIGLPLTIPGTSSQTVTVNFTPALVVASTPVILKIDFNLANSLVTNSGGAVIGVNFAASSLSASTGAIAPEASQEDDTGEIEALSGVISSVNGSTFVLNAGQSGAQLTFTTDGTTVFSDGLTNLLGALNQVVKVEGVTKSDGTLFAREIEGIEGQNGAEVEGLITQVTPQTSFTLLAQDGVGQGMDNTKVGATFTADVSGLNASKYVIDNRGMDFSGLTVPGTSFPFDATTIQTGQRVELDSTTAVPAAPGTIVADKVRLEQQPVGGTVANFVAGTGGKATFDLNLPADSYLGVLSGQAVVHVFQQAGTDNKFGTIANGNTLRVRGLLFWTGTTFNMIARRITP